MMMTTKNRVLAMERQRQGCARLKSRFPEMDNSEFCAMLAVPPSGATDAQLAAVVRSGAVADFAAAYRQRTTQ
jgi:hypothetical protein